MRIQNLKASEDRTMNAGPAGSADPISPDIHPLPPTSVSPVENERQSVEIALLRARIQHLELVVETARGLLANNHDRLLRRLHEVPRELVVLTNKLQRLDPQATW